MSRCSSTRPATGRVPSRWSLVENWLTSHPGQINGVIAENDEKRSALNQAIKSKGLDIRETRVVVDGIAAAIGAVASARSSNSRTPRRRRQAGRRPACPGSAAGRAPPSGRSTPPRCPGAWHGEVVHGVLEIAGQRRGVPPEGRPPVSRDGSDLRDCWTQGFDFSGRVAVVTGAAAGGIGLAAAHALARCRRPRLALLDLRPDLHAIAAELDGGLERHLACQVDLADPAIAEFVRRAERHFGALDILVDDGIALLDHAEDLFEAASTGRRAGHQPGRAPHPGHRPAHEAAALRPHHRRPAPGRPAWSHCNGMPPTAPARRHWSV